MKIKRSKFFERPVVESCKPEGKDINPELCKSCEINNCIKSLAYAKSFNFWTRYDEQRAITDFIQKMDAEKGTAVCKEKRQGPRFIKYEEKK